MGRDKALARMRESKACEMRTLGVDYDFIAKELGYADKSGAWRAVDRALRRRAVASADVYRSIAIAELTMLQENAWARAMSGDLKAIDTCVRAIDKRSRIIGLTGGTCS